MKYSVQDLANFLGLPVEFKRLGYHLNSNPNVLMDEPIKYITIHQTGNPDSTADAEAHHRLQVNDFWGKKTSWHWTVDETVAIQSFRDNRVLYHSYTALGNQTSMAIEMCINADKPGEKIKGKENYLKTLDNAAKLVAIKLTEHNLTVSDLKQHYDWSKKDCPMQLRASLYGYTWNNFIQAVTTYLVKLDNFINPPPVVVRQTAGEGKLFRVCATAVRYRDEAEEARKKLVDAGFPDAYLVVVPDPNYKGD